MDGFLVEHYWPGVTGADIIALHTALLALDRAGVYYLGAVLVPSDETVLLCFGARDAARVSDVARGVGLRSDRITPAVFYDG